MKWDWVPWHCPVCAVLVQSLGQSPALEQRANPEEELGKMVFRGPTHTVQPAASPLSRVSPSTTLVLLEGAELTAAGVRVLQWTNCWPLVPKSSRKVVFHHGLAGLLLQPCEDLLPWQPQRQRVRLVLFHCFHHQGLPKIQQAWGCSPALCRTSGVTSWKALRSLLCLPTLPHQPLAPADVSPVPGCRRVSLVATCSTGLPSLCYVYASPATNTSDPIYLP